MRHLGEDDLVLVHYCDEAAPPAAQAHLEACAECRAALEAIRRDLAAVEAPVPERAASYESDLWRRLQPQLAGRRRGRVSPFTRFWVPLAVAASLLVAFAIGRSTGRPGPAPLPEATRERILLVAVGDHLEKSQMLLVELVNTSAEGHVDLAAEQEWAQSLVADNRLYRQTLARAGDVGVASVLEELERVLMDVAHQPSPASAEDLEELRRRIEGRGILFKVRVLGSQVREKEQDAAALRRTQSQKGI